MPTRITEAEMEHIVPCRSHISDRFPVASFVVRVPPGRHFEVACATAPDLFHRDHETRRTRSNFYTTRFGGLLPAPLGEATCLIPHEQLRRFAGADRIYYALASYGDPRGGDARFTIAPDALDRVPFVELAADFTGRGLDRSRLGGSASAEPSGYGAPAARLRWGGDDALDAERAYAADAEAPVEPGSEPPYNDGYDKAFWHSDAQGDADLNEPEAERPAPSFEPPELEALHAQDLNAVDLGADDFSSGGPPFEDDSAAEPPADALAADDDELGESYEDARDYYGRVTSQASSDRTQDSPDPESHGQPYDDSNGALDAAQALGDLEYGDDDAEEELAKGAASQALGLIPLDVAEKVRLLRIVARAESGSAGYAAINPDREYSTRGHPAYQRYHVGLSFGFIQFTQRSGNLGQVLRKAKERSDRLRQERASETEPPFEQLFGPHAEELLRVTNATMEEERVAAVGGKFLWEPEWVNRFAAAGAINYVQNAQNEVAVTGFVDPNLSVAKFLAFDTPRSLSMLLDRCIHMGNGGGLSFVMRAIGPIRDEAQLSQALRALGAADLRAFQARHPNVLRANGRWTPRSHAAVLAALRELGAASPFTVLDRGAALRRLLDAAAGRSFQTRLRQLYENQRDFGAASEEASSGAYALA